MKAIGGYFEIELPHKEEWHQHAIHLNTGRNAFEYILRTKKYKKVFLPYYTCDVMLEPIMKLNLEFAFYSLNESLYPVFDFNQIEEEQVFVYTNYFDICRKQTESISEKCKNLIIDNSQAFFAPPLSGVDTFYSARKFFGVADGAYLYTDTSLTYEPEQDISYKRCNHLLGRADVSPQAFYDVFKQNDESFRNQPIKKMSNLTQRMMSSIDYKSVAEIRKANYHLLHTELKHYNLLNYEWEPEAVPMVYPLLIQEGNKIKKFLIDNKIYPATYWPNVFEWCKKDTLEYFLSENLVCLPIDQRYTAIHLHYMLKKLKLCIKY